MRILLAEDNPVNQKLAKMMLTKAGYRVDLANNGQEAFDKYTSSPQDFDLILMDVQMPRMDGIEATKAIRNWEDKFEAQSRRWSFFRWAYAPEGEAPALARHGNNNQRYIRTRSGPGRNPVTSTSCKDLS